MWAKFVVGPAPQPSPAGEGRYGSTWGARATPVRVHGRGRTATRRTCAQNEGPLQRTKSALRRVEDLLRGRDGQVDALHAGRSVSAYLLIPRERAETPLPTMVCFHQCNVDCILAKDAVVGKTGEATLDQRYGLELVKAGFVVLAPDSLDCGERNIPDLRASDENDFCWPRFHDHVDVGRPTFGKKVYDGMRAVDLLQSLDMVDSSRIGAIGHSMGQQDAFRAIAADQRVGAVILSGAQADKYLPLHAPRLRLAYRGRLDGEYPHNPERLGTAIDSVRASYEKGLPHWEEAGAQENLLLRIGPTGHYLTRSSRRKLTRD